ncbi:hypothetical protein TSAR_009853 [Trichomalopsis sarcophagae]|uniref:Putative nuclease HARBI1 n=1 Tax=Trichomalopsis sarcophagae TaxID=543379 RepID=A0A232EG05_9HYME|nr:hypothetical protein TSAR_009853 [Trichomalopsis sarcophagae]
MENRGENLLMVNELLSSSSNSDDEVDEVFLFLFDDIFGEERDHYRRRILRVQNFIETYLLYLLRPNLEGRRVNNHISPKKQLYITLYIFGTPDSYRYVTSKFDVRKATAWRAVKRVVKAICHWRNVFIRWPFQREAQETAARIYRNKGFPGVIGALDDTHIRISAPKEHQQSYINRKGFHSIHLQALCNDKLEFLHYYTDLPASLHDSRVYRYSAFQQRCTEEYFPDSTHLLADSAYTLQNHIIVPYIRNRHLTLEELYLNTWLSSVCTMIERAFAILK